MNSRSLPHFENPPVVEAVIGVQYGPINVFSNAHAGWFWKSFLGPKWDIVTEVPRLDDVFERFGEERIFALQPAFMIRPAGAEGDRTQITSSGSSRMIQVQNTRFILNWKTNQTDHKYPSFETLKSEFFANLSKFRDFTSASGSQEMEMNQWEVVYVNHIPRGELWNSISEWPQVVNFFGSPASTSDGIECDAFGGQWSLALPEQRGRLHVSLQHGRVQNAQDGEVMVLQMTARGGIKAGDELADCLEIGHAAIVKSFANITTKFAHQHWKRTK